MSQSPPSPDAPPSAPSEVYLRRQERRESSARTYARSLRLAIVEARGVHVTDADGKRYIDCLAAAGTLALGHNHPVVKEALRAALDQDVPFQTLDLTTPVKDAFTEELFAALPADFAARARVQFCGPTGADGVEAAVKLVKTATGRPGMIAFHGAYHGMTHGALALTGSLGPREPIAGLMPGVQFMPYPHDYRCPFGLSGGRGAAMSAAYLRSTLGDPESGVLPAGVLLEAVQGEGGVIPAPDGWLREVREITAAAATPLLIDEVQTGIGRTGALFAFEHAGIRPDVVVLSKAIGGGLPLSVVVYDESLDRWKPGAHAGTFRGNQLAMAAGAATLRFVRANGLPEHAAAMGARLTGHLRALQADMPWLGDVRGRGLMVGVEIVDPDQPPTWQGHPPVAPTLSRAIQRECLRRGLILELGGRHGAVVRFLPPLIITAEEIDTVATIFGEAARAARRLTVLPQEV